MFRKEVIKIGTEDPILRRFISKVDIRGNDECWEWKGSIASNGYGVFWLNDQNRLAHRIAYFIRNGEIPDCDNNGEAILICHTCDNKSCVNPNHLFLGTNSDNQKDAVKKGLYVSKKGESNPRAVLTASLVDKIKLLLLRNVSNKDIAKCFCISEAAVSLIKTGKRWS